MAQNDQFLPNWKIDVSEVSAGVFKVTAIHTAGARVQTTGTDVDKLVEQAKASAQKIDNEIALSKKQP